MHRRDFLRRAGSSAATFAVAGAAPRWLHARTTGSDSITPRSILAFLDAIEASSHELHSLTIRRNGQLQAQGHWAPYRAGVAHSLYSLSKSVTSTAVGFAIEEGRFALSDPVIRFFPERLTASPSANLAAMRVEDLLTMSSGHAIDTAPLITKEEDWVRTFLALPIEHEPGTQFLYNSGATYMLSAIVQQCTGQKLVDYLQPRLFTPLAIQEPPWFVCPRGINTGGWGLSLAPSAIADFGQFYLQRGHWRGRALLPGEWIDEATRFHIQQPVPAGSAPGTSLEALKFSSDWHQGYGYQFWRCRHEGYRGDGAFGQFCIVLPAQQTVIALTSFAPDMQGLLNLVWTHLLPGLNPGTELADPGAEAELEQRLRSLILAPPVPAVVTPAPQRAVSRYQLEPNSMGASVVEIASSSRASRFELSVGSSRHGIEAGMARWIEGETLMPYTPPEIIEMIGPHIGARRPSRVAASAAWVSPNTLEMHWRYIETPHHDIVRCRFEEDRVEVSFTNNLTEMSRGAHPDPRPVLRGRQLSA